MVAWVDVEVVVDPLVLPSLMEEEIHEVAEEIFAFHFQEDPRREVEEAEVHLVLYSL